MPTVNFALFSVILTDHFLLKLGAHIIWCISHKLGVAYNKRAEQFPIIIKLQQGGFSPYVCPLKREQRNAKARYAPCVLEKDIHCTTTGFSILHMGSV